VITEPILAPLRRVVPTIGMLDITVIVAYFGLQILESVIVRAL
jgi:YggT family protein